MEFITAEQFLKEDKKVQEVFIDWWKPSIGDLYYYDESDCLNVISEHCCSTNKADEFIKFKKDSIPLLTEGQLRRFIEDNTGSTFTEITYFEHENGQYDIYTKNVFFENLGNDLLQAYWKVAVYIAKESIKH